MYVLALCDSLGPDAVKCGRLLTAATLIWLARMHWRFAASRCAFLLGGLLRRVVRDRESAALVVAILLVGVVEGLEERFLLVPIVLVHLGLWQIRNVLVGHS